MTVIMISTTSFRFGVAEKYPLETTSALLLLTTAFVKFHFLVHYSVIFRKAKIPGILLFPGEHADDGITHYGEVSRSQSLSLEKNEDDLNDMMKRTSKFYPYKTGIDALLQPGYPQYIYVISYTHCESLHLFSVMVIYALFMFRSLPMFRVWMPTKTKSNVMSISGMILMTTFTAVLFLKSGFVMKTDNNA